MIRRLLATIEPYVLMLLATVLIATLLPPRGVGVRVFDLAADTAIVALFFVHGAKLSRSALLAGARHWRLHAAILATSFVLFPLLGLAIAGSGLPSPSLATGLLFLTLLPSTVQSSIAFTAIARGNVAAAVCSASLSNLLGIAVTPALAALLLPGTGGVELSFDSVRAIVLQLLVPFAAGHMLRPWIGAWIAARKRMVTTLDRGSILLVVYTAFGAAVSQGLWSQVGALELAELVGWCALLLTVVLVLTGVMARAMKLAPEDAVVMRFCGSKKSLATGVPMAGVLFPPAQVGVVLLPVMVFHQLQLIACAFLARRLADAVEAEPAMPGAVASG
ncbi:MULTISPECIES: bile acid:sodium symporter family protein [unclassified Sphingomonas]|uniref:bile acid:sodium symporter family protein n=1 Tax=unclassified Sphingomonas TaxID=196159 RepID=UPI00285C40E3|nr:MULTISPECIES: bile acid:sodium symporter family protein [unclassified Sphingomonas]MDR6115133.1 sodium/bile acid cotransporter 7 [Sphingomonas sp. SORGH_AS_0789]MDR6151192.1 sodium/bile acid cotransporter 7 [Sphingomonas sp. SORGH_AS_0742]